MTDYSVFIDKTIVEAVRVGIGEREIKSSRDKNFNDINARNWELIAPAIHFHLRKKVKEAGEPASIALLVGIAKEAAQRIRKES